jgi:hypothetical protein
MIPPDTWDLMPDVPTTPLVRMAQLFSDIVLAAELEQNDSLSEPEKIHLFYEQREAHHVSRTNAEIEQGHHAG